MPETSPFDEAQVPLGFNPSSAKAIGDHVAFSQLECCGVKEAHGIQEITDPKHNLLSICKRFVMNYTGDSYSYYARCRPMRLTMITCAHIVFSQAVGRNHGGNMGNYGEALAKFITEHNLGEVIETNPTRNPNSGNRVTAWLWTPNKRGLVKFWNDVYTKFTTE